MDRHPGLLFKVIRAYAFHDADREDLFQEISLQLWHSIPGFRGQSSESTWIYRVALNTAIKWSSREHRHREGRQSIHEMTTLLPHPDYQPDDRLAWLYEQIARLNEVDRSLTLLWLEGFPYKEIASLMGISESNVGVRIHRIKQFLSDQSQQQ